MTTLLTNWKLAIAGAFTTLMVYALPLMNNIAQVADGMGGGGTGC